VATRIRLRRTGKKKQAYYRVVVADARSPRDGRFIEVLGNYNPQTDPARVTIDEERALYWLKNGARPSDTVMSLLSKTGILARLAAERPDSPLLARPVKKKRIVAAPPEEKEPAGESEPAPAETEAATVPETPEVEAEAETEAAADPETPEVEAEDETEAETEAGGETPAGEAEAGDDQTA